MLIYLLLIENQKIREATLQGVEKHLWPSVTICNHVNIFTQNQPQKVRIQLEPGLELRQGIWETFFPQATQKIDFCPAWNIYHCSILFLKRTKLHEEFLVFSCFYSKHDNMHMLGLYSVLFTQTLSTGKKLKLVQREFA